MVIPRVRIYTAGVCDPDPGGNAGWGVVLTNEDSSHRKEISGGFQATTSDRMAIWAGIHGLKALTVPCWVRFYSTDEYFIWANNGSWVDSWKRHNWVNDPLGGRPHHVDLWKKFISWKDLHDIIFTHVDKPEYFPEIQRCEQMARSRVSGWPEISQVDLPVDAGYQNPDNQGDPMDDFDPQPPLCFHCSTPLISRKSKNSDPFELDQFYCNFFLYCPGCKASYLVPEILKHYPPSYLLPGWNGDDLTL